MSVDCETCREALSARLDGEPEPAPAADTDAHLDDCAACQAWQEEAAALTRRLRLRPATSTPDLVGAVLDAAALDETETETGPRAAQPETVGAGTVGIGSGRDGGAEDEGDESRAALELGATAAEAGGTRGWYARSGLAGVAVAQITLGLAQVLGSGPVDAETAGHGIHGASGSHLFNESTAWNLALGLGLLWTALRPRATTGMVPVVAGFVVVLGVFSVQDLIAGQATVQRVTSHAILVLGLVLLLVVHRGRRDPDRARAGIDTSLDTGSPPETSRSEQPAHPRPRLRPVSKHAA